MIYLALLITVLTVRQVAQAYVEYLFTNLSVSNNFMFIESDYITFGVIFFVLPLFSHEFLEVSHSFLRNLVFGILAVFEIMQVEYYHLFILPRFSMIPHAGFPHFQSISMISNGIKLTVFFYIVALFSLSLKKQFEKSGKIFSLVSIAFLVLWTVVDNLCDYLIYPASLLPGAILYFIWNLYIIWYIIKNYMVQKGVEASPQQHPIDNIDNILDRYNISGREKDVILLIIQGKTNKEMGNELFISDATIKTHIANIYRKLEVKNRVQLVNLIKETLE